LRLVQRLHTHDASGEQFRKSKSVLFANLHEPERNLDCGSA
jgi:hypothetical protein